MKRLIVLLFLSCLTIFLSAHAFPATSAPGSDLPPFVSISTLAPETAQTNDKFGQTLALSEEGNLLAVGAPLRDVGDQSDQGAVFIFRRGATGWTLAQTLTASDGSTGDQFGASLALAGPSDDVLLIGAPLVDMTPHTDTGTAYVFVYDGLRWTEETRLDPPETPTSSYDKRGTGVALSDDGQMAFVGAPGKEGAGGTTPGAVYLFSNAGPGWSSTTTIIGPSDQAAGLGSSLAAVGDAGGGSGTVTLFAAGLYSPEGAVIGNGIVYVYQGMGAVWGDPTSLVAADGSEFDEFGQALAPTPDGTSILIGAPRNAGRAYLFTRGSSGWSETKQFTPPGIYGQFGSSVALAQSGSLAAIGAPLNGSGAVHLYTWDGATGWMLAQTVRESSSGVRLGESVALNQSGEWLFAGAPAATLRSAAANHPLDVHGGVRVYVPGSQQFLPLIQRQE